MILAGLLNQAPKKNQNTSDARIITPRKVAGVYVDEDTALTLSAVYLSVKIISETIAALPFNFYERTPGADRKKALPLHPAKYLMMHPNDEMTGYNFWRVILAHTLLRGNGYAWIGRDRSNRAGELQLITPDRVRKGRTRNTGQIVYEVNNYTGSNTVMSESETLHLAGLGFDGLTGYSVIAMARRALAMGISAEQFGASFYENGAQLGTVIEVPDDVVLDEAGRDELLSTFNDKHKGVSQFHKTAVIDQGMKVQTIGVAQKDAQFIESRKFSVIDVCRWFNMPPHKLKELDRATFSNIEEQNIDFVQDTLMPWIVNMEQTINWKLLGANNNRQYVKYNLNGLLRGDSKSRGEWYRAMFDVGAYSPNMILENEDENGIGAKGDKHYVQTNLATLETINDPPKPQPPAPPPGQEPPAPPDGQPPTTTPPPPTNVQAFRPLIRNAVKKPYQFIVDKAKEKDIEGLAPQEFLVSYLKNRHDYIVRPFQDICQAMGIDNAHHAAQLVIESCTRYYGHAELQHDYYLQMENTVDDLIELFGAELAKGL